MTLRKAALFSLLALGVISGLATPANADKVGTLLSRAHAAQVQGNTELALRLAQSAIVADPARPASYSALGDVYAANNQPGFARTYYDEALSLDPAEPSALRGIAQLESNAKTADAATQ